MSEIETTEKITKKDVHGFMDKIIGCQELYEKLSEIRKNSKLVDEDKIKDEIQLFNCLLNQCKNLFHSQESIEENKEYLNIFSTSLGSCQDQLLKYLQNQNK